MPVVHSMNQVEKYLRLFYSYNIIIYRFRGKFLFIHSYNILNSIRICVRECVRHVEWCVGAYNLLNALQYTNYDKNVGRFLLHADDGVTKTHSRVQFS